MLRGKKSVFDKYAEKLIPTHVTIRRHRGNFTYVFEIEGYKGEETGEIYYERDDVLTIDRYLETKEAINTFRLDRIGLVLNFRTPEAIVYPESPPSGSAFEAPGVFGLQPGAHTWFFPLTITEATSR